MLLKAEREELDEICQTLDDHRDQLSGEEKRFHDALLEQLELGADGHVTPKQWALARRIAHRVAPAMWDWG